MRKIALLFVMYSWNVNAQIYLIAFSSNLESASGGAHKSDFSGADLYTAFYKPFPSDSIWNIQRITNYSGKAEIFPSISPDTNWIAYNWNQKTPWSNSVRLIKRSNNQEYNFYSNARFPQWINNNQFVLSESGNIVICRLSFPTATPTLQSITVSSILKPTTISDCEDPFPFENGTRIAFHGYNSTTGSTAICTVDSSSLNFEIISPFSAYGHAIVNTNSNEILATQASGSQLLRFDATGFNTSQIPLSLPTSPVVMSQYDSRFSTVTTIKWNYPSWGWSDYSFFASAVGHDDSGTSILSRLFYIEYSTDWTSYIIKDISSEIESKLGFTGKDFITSSAVVLNLEGASTTINENFTASVYPNPAKHELTIDVKNEIECEIYQFNGKTIHKTMLEKGSNKLNLTGFSSGTYIIRIGNSYQKLVVSI